jgi:hypothetical protein
MDFVFMGFLFCWFMGLWVQGLRGSGAQGLNSRYAAFKHHFVVFKHLTMFGVQTLLRSVQGSHFVRSSIPALQISIGDWTSFLNTAKQC